MPRQRYVLSNEIFADAAFIPVDNVWGVRTASCSKPKRDLEQFCSRIDENSKYSTKNVSIPSDPLPVGKL